jgi:hypothetical protein
MQQTMFDDLTLLMPYLADLQAKITRLQNCKRLVNTGEIELIVIIKQEAPKNTYTITQDDVPFNLKMELQCLLNDSIDELQRVYSNLANAVPTK